MSGRLFTAPSREKWIINETAMHLLGFENAADAVGQQLSQGEQVGEIVGVVKDFHHESLKTAIAPILFFCSTVFNYYTVKIETNQVSNTLQEVQSAYMEMFTGSPYEYFFLDEFFNRQYKAEQQFNTLFRLFSGLAIFIACLGLFGLSAYAATQRAKEIGIRKVLGASVKIW